MGLLLQAVRLPCLSRTTPRGGGARQSAGGDGNTAPCLGCTFVPAHRQLSDGIHGSCSYSPDSMTVTRRNFLVGSGALAALGVLSRARLADARGLLTDPALDEIIQR